MTKRYIVTYSFVLLFQCVITSINHAQSLFSKVSSEKSGVHFNNKIVDTKSANILLYSNFYGGGGVGIGDFNNDGLQDLVFAGNLVKDEIYLNKGSFAFQNVTLESGFTDNGGWSSGIVIADINNDGWQDIYITRELYDDNPELRTNVLYINQGKNGQKTEGVELVTFKNMANEYNLASKERTRHAGFLDYDGDGLLDIMLLNQPPNPGNYSPYSGSQLLREEWSPRLMKNIGNKFVDVSVEAGILKPCYPNSLITTDFDKDGDIDIYVTNDYEAPDFLWENQGNGTFKEIIKGRTNHISYYAMGVDAADINNDTYNDIMTLDMVAEDNYRIKSNMGGMYPEVFWKIVKQGGHHQYMFNALHLNNFGQSLSDIAQLSGLSNTDWSWSNVIADFDNDGWKDVYVTNGLLRDIRNTDGDKAFAHYIEDFTQDYIKNNPNAGDVNLLDILDLEEALSNIPSVPLSNYSFKNNGDLTFKKTTEDWGLEEKSFSNGCAYADLDNDGDLDLIVSNINDKAFIYQNNTNLTNNYLQVAIQDDANTPVFGTKITITLPDNSQQYIELTNVRGMYSTSQNIGHFGLDDHLVVNEIRVELPNGKIIYKQNIKANQKIIIDTNEAKTIISGNPILSTTLVRSKINPILHEENYFNDYDKQILLPHKMSSEGPAAAVSDLNQDQLSDLYIGASAGKKGRIGLLNNENDWVWTSQHSIEVDSLYEDVDAIFLDIDNDGDEDLYVVSGGNEFTPMSIYYQDRIYINDNGSFIKDENRLPKFRESGSCVRAADYDNDGDLDLFIGGRHQPWSYPSPTSSRILLNEDGFYKDVTASNARDLALIGMITDAVWTDYDMDNDLDLIVVGEWMAPAVLINNNGNFDKKTLINGTNGWWSAIEKLDIDNDGDEDYLLGNLGLNYKYKASVNEPFEVYYEDFDKNGSKDVVLSYYNQGEKYPLRGRSCSSQQIPEIKEKFPSYDIFASSNLEAVYGEEALDKALDYQAYQFANGWIENKGNGEFVFHQFPNELQISSINDFYIEDLDNDGYLDFISAGNKYDVEIETPRNDAGIGAVAFNQKGNGWKIQNCKESGLLAFKEVKHILPIMANKKSGLLMISNNNYADYYQITQTLKRQFRE